MITVAATPGAQKLLLLTECSPVASRWRQSARRDPDGPSVSFVLSRPRRHTCVSSVFLPCVPKATPAAVHQLVLAAPDPGPSPLRQDPYSTLSLTLANIYHYETHFERAVYNVITVDIEGGCG